MTATLYDLSDRYVGSLRDYLRGGGETSLREAYELGRRALMDGLGILEITVLYHQALAKALSHTLTATENARVVQAGESFFLESLAPFEMTHRGFQETNTLLQDSDERYRELFENATDMVFSTDETGRIVSLNPAGERLTGYRSGELPPVSLIEMVAPKYTGIVDEMLRCGSNGHGSANYEVEIIAKDGRRVPVEISSRPFAREGVLLGIQGIARDISERKLAQQALYHLNDALEEEVKRIAHALHDEAGQLLASVHLALERLASEQPQELGKKILPVRDMLFEIEEQLRRLSHELRPTILDDLGIGPALSFLTKGVAQRTGLEIHLTSSFEGRLQPAVETTLYRVTQEALNNISKHARAKNVWISMQANGEIHCSIRDDGVGFDVDAVYGRRGRMGLGLRGVQERLAAVGGRLEISAAPNEGTTLLVSIPKRGHDAATNSQ
jgi:two-component system, NarL family, sensor histidine kinase UhpB